jgi:hypothetical protein
MRTSSGKKKKPPVKQPLQKVEKHQQRAKRNEFELI